MRIARWLLQLLPWALVAAQAWLVDRLLRQHGRMLVEQEQIQDDLARLEEKVRGPDRSGGDRPHAAGRAAPTTPSGAAALDDPDRSRVDDVRARQYAHYHRLQDEALANIPPYPAERFSGAGIVIVAGGPQHYTNAWVCLTMLRRVLGCRLPIQVWYLGPHEMSPKMIDLLQRFDVECVDASEVQRRHPMRIAGGWECKPYAIVHSPFQEVILLDADNVPLIDPAQLLAWPEYQATGAVFWPDLHNLGREHEIWGICRVPYRDEPEVESGQIVVDKARCWRALQLTLHLNEHSGFYYRYVNGDKETYHLAWRMLDQAYSMPSRRPEWITGLVNPGDVNFADVLLQHDFDGRVVFQHRAGASWTAWGENLRVPGFEYEAVCQDALRELRQEWDGRIDLTEYVDAASPAEAQILQTRYFLYRRIGTEERVLALLPGEKIGVGGTEWERAWRLDDDAGPPTLVIEGLGGVTCRLVRDDGGGWRGRWLHHDRVPVELIPLDGRGFTPDTDATGAASWPTALESADASDLLARAPSAHERRPSDARVPIGGGRRADPEIVILFYNAMWDQPIDVDSAPVPAGCRLTTDARRFADATAVVFHIPSLTRLPDRKPPGQLWVAWSLECDANYPQLRDPNYMRRFDLTMTYRLDSDVPIAYTSYYVDVDNLARALRTPPKPKSQENLVTLFISSGMNRSGRIEYAAELMRYLDVHSYGKVLKNREDIPDDQWRPSKLDVIANYKFDLAFENAVTEDYVSEKFFDPLIAGVVPVYRGAPNVERFAPGDHCFINTADFSGPEALARYLLHLDQDEAEYQAYLAWKERPFRPAFLALLEGQREPLFSRLCRTVRARKRDSP